MTVLRTSLPVHGLATVAHTEQESGRDQDDEKSSEHEGLAAEAGVESLAQILSFFDLDDPKLAQIHDEVIQWSA